MKKVQERYSITLTGDLGSGKSVVGKLLHEELKADFHSTGSIQRSMAQKQKMDTLAFNRYAEAHHEIDYLIDDFTKNLATEDSSFVLDSRMGWCFVPNSFKVYLAVRLDISGQRIYGDDKRRSESYASPEAAMQAIVERQDSEQQRFQNLYQVKLRSPFNYNLIVDTSCVSPAEVVRIIILELATWQAARNKEPHLRIALPDFISSRDIGASEFENLLFASEERSQSILQECYQFFAPSYAAFFAAKNHVGASLFVYSFPVSPTRV